MRVVAGRWRGRRLRSPRQAGIRPTTDRVKEALFSILGPRVAGSLVLDLCCGAGGLGVEALSRGAGRVLFVDRSARALDTVRANLELCGAEPGAYELIRAGAREWLDVWEPPRDGQPWIVLADPPYRTALAEAIMDRVDALAAGPGFAGAVVESGRRSAAAGTDPVAGWERRRYGESVLAVRRPSRGG
jgi:16S rRNA (guanine966-N2)-methyltransferase